ncbi:MAG: hypothetical protein IPI40_09770 [Betaproteobacteria bacterium]|nr:hypothetical protein [Betaproteobacteria bacterium]
MTPFQQRPLKFCICCSREPSPSSAFPESGMPGDAAIGAERGKELQTAVGLDCVRHDAHRQPPLIEGKQPPRVAAAVPPETNDGARAAKAPIHP